MTLGKKIKKLRVDKGLTQKDLANKLYVTFQTVSKWENDENEPDVSTLKELSKVFGCSIEYLISEEECTNPNANEIDKSPATPDENATKTVIIHQKEMHVCERCQKDIPEDDLAMEDVLVHYGDMTRSASYRKAYYHKECLKAVQKERFEKEQAMRAYNCSRAKKFSFGFSIPGGVLALVITLLVLLLVPECAAIISPGLAVGLSILAGVGIFCMLYCIISGSYIYDVFIWCATLSIKFPGLIFSWDLEGFAWVISMKILFAILGFLFGICALVFAIALSAALGIISFPFILVHNNRTQYEDFD